jgi:hypothetical protein
MEGTCIMIKKFVLIIVGGCASLAIANQAFAVSLTAAAVTQGFTLSTYESGYANNGIGPVGLTVMGSNVLTTDYATGYINVKPDVDGQTYTTGFTNYGQGVAGLTVLNNNIYLAQQFTGAVDQINPDGTFNHTLATYGGATAIVGNSATNHLYISNTAGGGIREIDLLGATVSIIGSTNGGADGLTVSADNSTIYAEQGGHIFGYNTTTHAQIFDSGLINGSDGVSIGAGTLAGNLFVNTNFGQLFEVNISTLAQTLLITGGSRGDFVTVDPNNASMLFTQSDSVLRLTAPAGGGFGGTPVPLPSAASMGALGMGLIAGLAFFKRRRVLASNLG